MVVETPRLGPRLDTYWNFLIFRAVLAVRNMLPQVCAVKHQAKLPKPMFEFVGLEFRRKDQGTELQACTHKHKIMHRHI